jgi:pyruvate formate lyase activating enzyme
LKHLETRYGLLDGIVFSGGEPTMQSALYDAIKTVKNMEFAVGLHSGGAYPDALARVLPLINWIGFDIKATPDFYEKITNNPSSWNNAKRSIELVLNAVQNSDLGVQFRTTVDPTVMNESDVEELKAWTKAQGINDLVLQEVRDMGVNDEYKEKLLHLKNS